MVLVFSDLGLFDSVPISVSSSSRVFGLSVLPLILAEERISTRYSEKL